MVHLNKYSFLKDCTAMELIALAKESNDVGDFDLRRAVLIEVGVRQKQPEVQGLDGST